MELNVNFSLQYDGLPTDKRTALSVHSFVLWIPNVHRVGGTCDERRSRTTLFSD